jgi:hypothetical protein
VEGVTNLRLGWALLAVEQRLPRKDHPRSTETALQRMLFVKCLLQRRQAGSALALNSGYPVTIGLDREHRAGFNVHSVHANRTSTALRGVTPDVGAGQAGELAKKKDEEQPRLDIGRNALAVDINAD